MEKKKTTPSQALKNFMKVHKAASLTEDGTRCMIAPHPTLKRKIKQEVKKLKASIKIEGLADKIKIKDLSKPGLNDGLVVPGNTFELGTTLRLARKAKSEKAPLRGVVRVIVVLADFSDKPMKKTKAHFESLFFSRAKGSGSVYEYYKEVTNGLVDIQGEVIGPLRMPLKLSAYAHGKAGMGSVSPNARTLAKDAAKAANPLVDFSQYDNDHDGHVDAFVVVHAGTGGEVSNKPGDIWSHKWVLEGGSYQADNSKVYSYLTVPEDCKLGVCAHELGHLLFGFPDLYDTDYSSEGIGDWCLMSGGSWNNGGDTPAHPSAWCKCNQGWVNVVTPTSNLAKVSLPDVKKSNEVYKLWKDGAPAEEYFLVENRQQTKFDEHIPASGLLVWHIDDAVSSNENERHYKVALVQADGKRDLETGANRGDLGDCFPGEAKKKVFDSTTSPSSLSYGGVDTKVALKNISSAGSIVRLDINVK